MKFSTPTSHHALTGIVRIANNGVQKDYVRSDETETIDDALALVHASPFDDGLVDYFWDCLGGTPENTDGDARVSFTLDSLGRFDHESSPVFLDPDSTCNGLP